MNYGMAAPRIATQVGKSMLSSYYSTQWKMDMSMVEMLVFFNNVVTERESGINLKQEMQLTAHTFARTHCLSL
eukprot:5442521-Ditylum_brightwellii.AAC.1